MYPKICLQDIKKRRTEKSKGGNQAFFEAAVPPAQTCLEWSQISDVSRVIAAEIGRRQSGENPHIYMKHGWKSCPWKNKKEEKRGRNQTMYATTKAAVCVSATRWGNCTRIDHLLAVKETKSLIILHMKYLTHLIQIQMNYCWFVLVPILFIAFSRCRVAAAAHRPPLSGISLPWPVPPHTPSPSLPIPSPPRLGN